MSTGTIPEQAGFSGAATSGFFGHPRGLATLFFTEMWERFSYYGMRALLVLFMTASAAQANAGAGYDIAKATAIYGLYTALVYLMSLPGGWVADNLWGQRRAVFIGGCIIAAGHFSMAIPIQPTFFLGLGLIILGTGLLKPNVSTMVGDLYPESGARRDAGFSIFYMGINLGAFLGPILCGLVGESGFLGVQPNWHFGFSLAGIGMVLGLIQYSMGGKYLGTAGYLSEEALREAPSKSGGFYRSLLAVFGLVAILVLLMTTGTLDITLQQLGKGLGYGIIALCILYFVYLIGFSDHTKDEKKKLVVIFWLFILAALFWSGFEQAGSSMNLFAANLTNRVVFGWEAPAAWLQSVNSIFIIIFAPIFGFLWTWLASRRANPSIPLKFALGLLGLSAGFFVLAWGAANATPDHLVSPSWLVVTYFLHTVGELCLSPVGLSSITKLAPRNRVGQMMGIWFVGSSLGNLFAGLVAGRLETLPANQLFSSVATFSAAAGVLALLVSPGVRRLMGDVK